MDVQTGDTVWPNSEFGGAGISFAFDDLDNLYVCGGLSPDFFAVSKNGETLKKIGTFDEDYFWSKQIAVEGDQVIITLAGGPDGFDMGQPVLRKNVGLVVRNAEVRPL